MQDLSHDMENLLQRAAEAYPLQSEDRWESIALQIELKQKAKKKTWFSSIPHSLLLLTALLFLFLELSDYKIHRKPNYQYSQSIEQLPLNHYSFVNTDHTFISKKLKQTDTENKRIHDKKIVESESVAVVNSSDNDITNYKFFSVNSRIGITTTENYSTREHDSCVIALPKSIVEKPMLQFAKNDDRKKRLQVKNTGFYFGVIAGLHLNAVKNQTFTKKGSEVGIITGYRLNKKVSLETGLLISKEYYWTEGKYFNTKKMAMPPGMEMIEVHGSTNVIKVPIHFRYDVLQKSKGRLFTSAGISSYIMTEENNRYHTFLNGVNGEMNGSYKKNKTYTAATFDFSVGFEKDIAIKHHLRLEPYVQLPLREIGIGNLPLKTVGLRVGLTRSTQ